MLSSTIMCNGYNAKRLAVYVPKGGSAKTTTAVHLAAELGRAGGYMAPVFDRDKGQQVATFDQATSSTLAGPGPTGPGEGRRVLLVDCDPQANATYWLDAPEGSSTLYDVATGSTTLPAIVQPTGLQGVDLIPAGPDLIALEPTLRAKPGAELWLQRQVRTLSRHWSWIIFDCAPGLDLINTGTLAAVERVLAPVEPSPLGLAGIARLLDTIGEVRELLNPDLALLGVLPVKVDSRTVIAREAITELRAVLEGDVLEALIPHTVRLAECPSHHQTINTYAPSSPAVDAYRALAREVEARWPND